MKRTQTSLTREPSLPDGRQGDPKPGILLG